MANKNRSDATGDRIPAAAAKDCSLPARSSSPQDRRKTRGMRSLYPQSVSAQAEHVWRVSVSRPAARANCLPATIVVIVKGNVDMQLQTCQRQQSRRRTPWMNSRKWMTRWARCFPSAVRKCSTPSTGSSSIYILLARFPSCTSPRFDSIVLLVLGIPRLL